MQKTEAAELLTFLEIVEQGGLARAAAQLGVTPSAVSQSLTKLEQRLGVRLLHRTTRHVAPTEAGAELAARLREGFSLLRAATQTAYEAGQAPRGTIRLAVSAVAAHLLIAPHAAAFTAAHPGITLETSVNDRLVDIVAEGFDAGIRRGDLLQADMIQQRLTADTRLVAVAAATYWQARPPCQAPQDLHGHDCIRIRSLTTNSIRPWHFARSGEHLDVRVTGSLVVDTTSLALEAACAGAGIAYLALDHLQQPLADGRLHPVLQDWSAPRPGLFLYHPGRRHVPATLKLLTRFLRSRVMLRTPASLVTPGIAGKHGSTR